MYDQMVAYIDESGAVQANEPFIAGAWFTAHEQMWHNIIDERRDVLKYNYTLHFHKISRKDNDWQHRVVRRIFMDLRRVSRSWYSRMLHVNPLSLDSWSHLSTQDKYDSLIANLVLQFATRAFTQNMKIVISNKSRPAADDFLPKGLEELLNEKSKLISGPIFTVELSCPKNNDLLQLADLLTSGVRQALYPSRNKNKCMLAGLLQPLIDDRISIWNW